MCNKLAVLGEPPAFSSPLHVGRPNIGSRVQLQLRISEMIERRWFTNNGPLVQEFERRIADWLGVKHCVCVCNATIGLEIAIRAAGLKGEVLVPSYTFIATVHALQWQEITPVFADIDPATHNLNPIQIERNITPKTSGIIGTHLWGRPCDIEALTAIAQKRNLILMFDAAHGFGCSYRGKRLGGFGLAEIFSFHATKFLNSFEGGAITTNDDALASKVRLMTNFGFAGLDNVIAIGTNGKMTEVCAAMGLTSLECIEEIIATNLRNYKAYYEGLRGLPGISLIEYSPTESNNYQYIVIEIDSNMSPLNRDELVNVLRADNVLARKYFWPCCHRMEPYRSYFPHAGILLPETERIAGRVIVLPTGTSISLSNIEVICGLIRCALENATEVRQALEHAM